MLGSAVDTELVSRSHKKNKPHKLRRIIYIVLAVIVFLYLAAAIFVSLRNNITTAYALNGSISESFRTSGYVLREQEVINAPKDGFFECIVSEGDRVKKGQVVAYMFDTQPDPSLMEQLRKTHMLLRSKSGELDSNVYLDEGSGSKAIVSEKVRNMSDVRTERNLKTVRQEKSELNLMLSRKSESGEANTKTAEQLNQELNSLKQQAGGCVEIVAPVGGIFSSGIDNMEDKLTMDSIDSILPSFITELDRIDIAFSDTVAYGQPLCKIVNNYKWAYAAVVDEKKIEGLKEGSSVNLSFYDLANDSVKGTISHISDSESGKKAIVVSTNRYVDGIYSSSRANAEVILIKVDGIRLPVSCLHVQDGVTGVYVVRLDTAKFVSVNVKYKNEDWAVVSAVDNINSSNKLQIYDEVIVEGKNISDGKVVR